jgi:thiosulfate/3-mercaptopyruvate sulfurtransferase
MSALRRVQNLPFLLFSVLISLCGISAFLLSPLGIYGDEKKPADPWPSSQTLPASGLASELADKNGTPPTVVYVGFRTLFAGGHVAGASFNGTASTDEGLTSLKEWVEHLPRSTNLVIYCGCCPFDKCPNIRPAYTALSNMGFKKVRVLVLPTNFATDWVDKGYPIQKGM